MGSYLCCCNNNKGYFSSSDKAGGSSTLSVNSLRICVFQLKRNQKWSSLDYIKLKSGRLSVKNKYKLKDGYFKNLL